MVIVTTSKESAVTDWSLRPTPSSIKRFWAKVNKVSDDECWLWNASTFRFGHGAFWFGGKVWGAHQFSYLLHNQDYDKEKFVCHTCDVPQCVNPKHLYLGDHDSNMGDMVKRGRSNGGGRWHGKGGRKPVSLTHCPHGHLWTEETTYLEAGKYRRCKICRVESVRKSRIK